MPPLFRQHLLNQSQSFLPSLKGFSFRGLCALWHHVYDRIPFLLSVSSGEAWSSDVSLLFSPTPFDHLTRPLVVKNSSSPAGVFASLVSRNCAPFGSLLTFFPRASPRCFLNGCFRPPPPPSLVFLFAVPPPFERIDGLGFRLRPSRNRHQSFPRSPLFRLSIM